MSTPIDTLTARTPAADAIVRRTAITSDKTPMRCMSRSLIVTQPNSCLLIDPSDREG
jgi:hypothetical protein